MLESGVDALRTILQIAEDIRTQDNLCTDAPIFIVQRQRRRIGIDPNWCSDVTWISDGDEANPQKRTELEKKYQNTGEIPDGWNRTGFIDYWEFVTACFTRNGCEEYLRLNGHNLGNTRIYAEGSYRNNEFRTIRDMLIKS